MLYKVFTAAGEYVAACKRPEEAAALMDFLGDGASIRLSRNPKTIVWHEGFEEQSASESYDFVARVVYEREGQK